MEYTYQIISGSLEEGLENLIPHLPAYGISLAGVIDGVITTTGPIPEPELDHLKLITMEGVTACL